MAGDVAGPGAPALSTLENWLAALIAAPFEDQRTVAINGIQAGIGYEKLVCDRHNLSLTWIAAYRHVSSSENDWRTQQRDPAARLHEVGDLRPATSTDNPPRLPWSTSSCRSCGARVVWATTQRDKRMPVDAGPDPAGNVVLTMHPDESVDGPLAVVVHEHERGTMVGHQLHTSHFQTCPNADRHRRTA